MTPLEQRYRALLRRLPTSYRRQWEDDMVATYLATTIPDDPEEAEYVEHCGRPSREERWDILRLAVRLRLGGVGDPPHAQAWGDAVCRVTLVGLLANTVSPIGGLWRRAWLSGGLGWPPLPPAVLQMASPPQSVWQSVLEAATLLWVVAFIAAVMGHRRGAAVAGVVAAVPTVTWVVHAVEFAMTAGFRGFLVSTLAMAVVTVLPLLAMAAFHGQSLPLAPRPWLVALGGTAVLAAVPAYLSLVPNGVFVDRAGLWSVAVAGAAAVHLTRGRGGRSDLGRTMALAIVGGVVLTLRVVTLLDLMQATEIPGAVGAGIVQALVVATLGAALWAQAARALRELPVPDNHAPQPPTLTA